MLHAGLYNIESVVNQDEKFDFAMEDVWNWDLLHF